MQYNLVFSTDDNYLPYLFVLCQSILDHLAPCEADAQDELIFNVLIDQSVNLDEVNTKGQSFLERNKTVPVKASFKWHIIDANNFSGFSTMHRESRSILSTYYRLLIGHILPENLKYTAYLDVDMLVLSDIRELFNQHNLDNMVLGAVVDPGIANANPAKVSEQFTYAQFKNDPSQQIKIPRKHYFNAGMLLINLEEWRKQHIGEECLKWAEQLKLQFHDQDLLNYVCQGKVKLLELSWNIQSQMFCVQYNPKSLKYDIRSVFQKDQHWLCETPNASEFEQQMQHPRIVHFNDHKPWQPAYLGSSLFYAPTVPVFPKLQAYCDAWSITRQKVVEFPNAAHVLNCDAIDINTLKLEQINQKRRKDRKLILSILAFSLLLNCVTLICSLLF